MPSLLATIFRLPEQPGGEESPSTSSERDDSYQSELLPDPLFTDSSQTQPAFTENHVLPQLRVDSQPLVVEG